MQTPINRFWNAYANLSQFAPETNDLWEQFLRMHATYEKYVANNPRRMILQDVYDWLHLFVRPKYRVTPDAVLQLLQHIKYKNLVDVASELVYA